MKVIEAREALLTNYEVKQFLDIQRKTHVKNHRTISVELSAYLRDRPTGNPQKPQTEQAIEQFMLSIKESNLQLEKAEILQLINSAPTSMPVLYNVVEECEERFNQQELEHLLTLCAALGAEPTHR